MNYSGRLPCPFCGSEDGSNVIGTAHFMQCHGCWATGPETELPSPVPINGEEIWNKRAAVITTDERTLLSSCPWCGGLDLDCHFGKYNYVKCNTCGAHGPSEQPAEGSRFIDLSRKWNARAEVAQK